MRVSRGESEDGVIVGNTYDKYGSGNPIVQRIMAGFDSALQDLVRTVAPGSIHEAGCGEGYWVMRWQRSGHEVHGTDFSATVIKMAKENALALGLPQSLFKQRDVYDLDPAQDSADLVVCCEVLEHLEEPELALSVLSRLNSRHTILSVPREPLWSVMNMARGRYWRDLGNTPGHIQRWSRKSFTTMVKDYFQVDEIRSPTPWTMLLCSPLNHPRPGF